MKTDFSFKHAKVGDKVYHVAWGWVKVTDNDGSAFEIQNEYWYNYNGKFSISNENPTIYPYNPFEQNEERDVEVRIIDIRTNIGRWEKRKAINFCNNFAVCLNDKGDPFIFSEWREIQPQRELSQEEKINILWEKYGKK